MQLDKYSKSVDLTFQRDLEIWSQVKYIVVYFVNFLII